jgi:4-hydroxybenzoate polyprenyltransferase
VSLFRRLWIYQSERFPLVRTVPLMAVFSAASVNVSALFAGRPLPGPGAYATALALGLIIFFQMRAADEWKDREIDRRYRPERAVPRGLVSLQLILGIAIGLVPVGLLLAWVYQPALLLPLALVWGWLALMTAEFGVKDWLTARPVVYLVSHMAIMPLIDLLLTGVEWTSHDGPPHQLWLFLALSLVNGCVLEIGRKTWAPENEREGVESYSDLWGAGRSVMVWLGFVALAGVLLARVGAETSTLVPVATVAALGFVACAAIAMRFRSNPTIRNEKLVDAAAGLWVLVCYAAAGFLPLLFGGSA